MLICPVCSLPLIEEGKSLHCLNNHCYDRARQGYINLLPVQHKHSLHPGDTKEMLVSRRSFLDSGFYSPIRNEIILRVKENIFQENPVMIDVGCGEGYYTKAVFDALSPCAAFGFDISKDAIRMACTRSREIEWVVATASRIPVETERADLLTAVFSLFVPKEYARILKPGGIAIEVTAGAGHLIELKNIIYDEVFERNKTPRLKEDGFMNVSCTESKFSFTLENKSLCDLLHMTPHFWRIREENRLKLESTPKLTLTAHFFVRVLKRI